METSARLGLPLLAPGQAQKELFHNEAIAALDLAVQASVEAVGIDMPPPDPRDGDCWVVGNAPAGDWAGQAGAIAGWSRNGWRFVAAAEGMAVWNRATGGVTRRVDGDWRTERLTGAAVIVEGNQVVGARQPAIVLPQGGATVDAEARGTLAAVLAAMRMHGLIAG
jgi:hypothetical protein